MVDVFTKFVVLYPVKKATTIISLKKIIEHYIPYYGKPEKIQSDWGTQFTSDRWLNTLKNMGIKTIFSSIRHPQSNTVERVDREISKFFKILIKDKHKNWSSDIKIIQKILNESCLETTEFIPIELQFNKKPTRYWDKYMPKMERDELNLNEKLKIAHKNIMKKGEQRARKYNEKNELRKYCVNDKVLLKSVLYR